MKLTNAVNMDFFWCGTAPGKCHFHKGQHQIQCFIALTRNSNVDKDCSFQAEIPSIVGANQQITHWKINTFDGRN